MRGVATVARAALFAASGIAAAYGVSEPTAWAQHGMQVPPDPAASDPNAVPLGEVVVGKTVSAIVYVPHPPGVPGGGELSRYMFQAYLQPGGGAQVRVWDTAHDSYTPVVQRRWEMAGSRFCVDLSTVGPGVVCADIHVWGPRIAGMGTQPYVMLDGDLTAGDSLVASR